MVNIMRKSLNCTKIYVMYALFRFSMRFLLNLDSKQAGIPACFKGVFSAILLYSKQACFVPLSG